MKYFLDTEFLEGKQKDKIRTSLMASLGVMFIILSVIVFKQNTLASIIIAVCLCVLGLLFLITSNYAKTPPTIDLISIGIVAEDGREYYAISKDFNLKEAWNRYDLKINKHYPMGPEYLKVYWIRENVLKPIFEDIYFKDPCLDEKREVVPSFVYFGYKNMKKIIEKHGKTNKQISEEIFQFCNPSIDIIKKTQKQGTEIKPIKFYAYYADYDWVAFCWLFGKMIDLPKQFPMYCRDLKQMLDNAAIMNTKRTKGLSFETSLSWMKTAEKYPKQTHEHNALSDAKFNLELYKFLQAHETNP